MGAYMIDGGKIRRIVPPKYKLIARFTFGPCKVVHEAYSLAEAEEEMDRISQNPKVISSIEVWDHADEIVRILWRNTW
jgi:hypothetical protein